MAKFWNLSASELHHKGTKNEELQHYNSGDSTTTLFLYATPTLFTTDRKQTDADNK